MKVTKRETNPLRTVFGLGRQSRFGRYSGAFVNTVFPESEAIRGELAAWGKDCDFPQSAYCPDMSATATPLDDLIACPQCDALYRAAPPAPGERAVCHRCHTVLIAPRRGAGLKIIALALASLVLVVGVLTFPFIGIRRLGLTSDATVLDAALAFSGPLLILSLAVFAAIIFLPLLRLLLTLYVLAPVVMDRAPWPGAKRAFRWAERLRPWSMAEIFVIGCAVALVKLSDLARVELGPAFWMFVVLVVLIVVQDTFMCRWSVWKSLDR